MDIGVTGTAEKPYFRGQFFYQSIRLQIGFLSGVKADIFGKIVSLCQYPLEGCLGGVPPVLRALLGPQGLEHGHVVVDGGEAGAVTYRDSVGIGMYRIDLHPSTGGDNYIDVASSPFEIPLGALIPRLS